MGDDPACVSGCPCAKVSAVALILVVDDEPLVRRTLRALLEQAGHRVREAENGVEASRMLPGEDFDLVLTDLMMPEADGLEVLRRARDHAPGTPVIVLTASTSISDCVDAMREGAYNFLVKPSSDEEIMGVIEQALAEGRPLARQGVREEPAAPSAPPPAPPAAPATSARQAPAGGQPQAALIGESPALKAVLRTVEQVAPSDATVLLLGESGTGKEVVARLLHAFSPRVGRAFVAVNCGAIPEGLVESELFGHARGAFTGATEARPGKFVEANGGTLFLDEIGELPLGSQVKLLRVLQERVVTPVGEARTRTVDTRVIAATNQNLEALVREGKFRSDLFFRVNVVPITLPALRERREDVPRLARHFLDSACRRHGRRVELSEEAVAAFRLHAWPGNVRELENLIERLVILNRGGKVRFDDLPASLRTAEAQAAGAAAETLKAQGIDLTKTVAEIEALLIDAALRAAEGNKTKAAELLGLNRTTLLDKLKRAGG
jgi:DNA-binding NtrC family response regulator